MKTLNIQIDDSLYEMLLEMLKKIPESQIKIQEVDSANSLSLVVL